MKNNWEKDIHDRLGNFEQDAPDGLWVDISKKMAEWNRKKSAGIYNIRRLASVAAAACALLILGYTFYVHNAKDENPQMPQSCLSIAKNEDREPSIANDSKTTGMAVPLQTYLGNIGKTEVCRECSDSVQSSFASEDNVEANRNVYTSESDAKQNDSTLHKKEIEHQEYRNNHLAYDNTSRRKAANNATTRWTVSTSAMGAAGWGKTSKYIVKPVVAAGPDNADWQDNPMLGIALFNQGKEVTTEYKHHLPVRIGVKVGYAISERLSIESGLSYTLLSSDIKSGSDDNYFTGEQKLNYVGIPVGVKYNALMFKHLCLYGTANTLLEKCVSGNVTNNYVINKATNKTETHTIGSKPLQFSVGASVGVQVDILDNVGIYAEPGLSYHFNDHSSLQTIYKEKPLNFNLSVGIRYTINK